VAGKKESLGQTVGRIAFTFVLTLSVAISFLTFPEYVPWMIATWLLAYSIRLAMKKRAWPALLFCFLVLMFRRMDWAPGLLVLMGILIAQSAIDLGWKPADDRKVWRVRAVSSIALVWAAWIVMALNWQASAHSSREPHLDENRPVVFVGDSLMKYGFPSEVQKQIRLPVLDLSRSGITTQDALEFLAEIEKAKPMVLVIELGGHDYLEKRSRETTRNNLEKFIRSARNAGAEVLLFEIPRGFIMDPWKGLERGLAREHDLELIPDSVIRNLVIHGPGGLPPQLSDDGIHPNAKGSERMAGAVVDALVRLYGDGIKTSR
jgi:acyl-CoA thioesterase-1